MQLPALSCFKRTIHTACPLLTCTTLPSLHAAAYTPLRVTAPRTGEPCAVSSPPAASCCCLKREAASVASLRMPRMLRDSLACRHSSCLAPWRKSCLLVTCNGLMCDYTTDALAMVVPAFGDHSIPGAELRNSETSASKALSGDHHVRQHVQLISQYACTPRQAGSSHVEQIALTILQTARQADSETLLTNQQRIQA